MTYRKFYMTQKGLDFTPSTTSFATGGESNPPYFLTGPLVPLLTFRSFSKVKNKFRI